MPAEPLPAETFSGRCACCGHTANWHTGRIRPPSPPPPSAEELAWDALPDWKKKKEMEGKKAGGGMSALAKLKKSAKLVHCTPALNDMTQLVATDKVRHARVRSV